MDDKHICCACAPLLKEKFQMLSKETKRLRRDLKTAQRRIARLKTQKQKLLATKKKREAKTIPTFFR